MKLEFFAISDAATESQGKLNILGAFDTIFAQSVPVVHPFCSLTIKLRMLKTEGSHHNLSIRLTDNDANLVMPPIEISTDITIPDDAQSGAIASVMNIQGLLFPRFGEYHIVLLCDGEEVSSIPLTIKQQTISLN